MQRSSPNAIPPDDGMNSIPTSASMLPRASIQPPPMSIPPPAAATSSPMSSPSTKDRKKPKQQPRQLMSCSKCRERKVKCDRTHPCSACCARGHPKDCFFVAGEGTFVPMQQSAELRRLRAENQRLKERLLESKVSVSGDSDDGGPSVGQTSGITRFGQRKFGADEPAETIYFGSPSFASVVADLNTVSSDSNIKSLSHPPVGAHEIFSGGGPTVYPFPTIWTTGTWIQGLYSCLEPWESIADLITSFSERENSVLFPKMAMPVSLADVENFIADFENNATTFPDSLALIFAVLACEMKRREYDSTSDRGESARGDSEAEMRRNLFLSASMQALRQSSFACQPTLLSIQAMILICAYLSSDGKALDAWTILGTTIRMAQAIGLHRNPKALEPLPSLRESNIRRKLWWQLLYTDQQYSMALGRPLGISAIGDCPYNEHLTTDAAMIRLTECVDQITILGRQLLGTAPLQIHRISTFTDKLQTLLDTIPEDIQFHRSWTSDASQIPEAPLDEFSAVIHLQVHSYMLLLQRQRLDTSHISSSASEHSQNQGDFSFSRTSDPSNQRALANIADSCKHVLDVFDYLFKHRQSILVDWTVKQQALTAAVVLLQDTRNVFETQHKESVETALSTFQQLSQIRTDAMSRFAVGRLTDGINKLQEAQLQRRRSSAGGVPFPDFYSGSGAMRRDSQISWSSGPRNSTAGYDHDLYSKSPEKEKPAISNEGVGQLQVAPTSHPSLYHTSSDANLPRRATVSGVVYPSVKVEVPPRPPTGFSGSGHFFYPQTSMVQAQSSPQIPVHGTPQMSPHGPSPMSQYQFTNQFHQPAQYASGQQSQMFFTNPHSDVQMYDMPVAYPHAQQQQRQQPHPSQHPQQQQMPQLQHAQPGHHYFNASFPPTGMPSDVKSEASNQTTVTSAATSFPSHAHHWG
ncbi:hypothetical protein K461DRAFT_157483 [Myriangium duriaei CBS 260.36]|uniref:Zn(2)-C6 fungal-type domain-containing protein n=1 Tax=Myriangium duriaei CBS 260.36 TaxID=1168546 RepID=A0A9P4J1M8_9PEZI|nr:hypothetical protein K461DRAFT_157483 [Myriangium duriaei CBS 260.36]